MTNKTKKSAKRGFTLIELMIVVAIIGILAAVAIPKFADLINKSKEGATKGSLGALRSSLAVYYGDWEGIFPRDMGVGNELDCMMPKYLKGIPKAKIPAAKDESNPGHSDSALVFGASTTTLASAPEGGWHYADIEYEPDWGNIAVLCRHNDSKGNRWTSY